MKCGIEIHQRIAGRKLFCNCVPSAEEGKLGQGQPQPAQGQGSLLQASASQAQGGSVQEGKGNGAQAPSLPSASQNIIFARRLHAVLSELGELDSAVRLESARQRTMHYYAPRQSCCLVEADEEPPRRINHEALCAVLLFCRLVGSNIVDEVHVMRKNVIDGSNTSGFQRTAVVGLGGEVKTPVGSLGIQTICIEEESAGILEAGKDSTADFELSRLGIPLVEIATEPTLKSGQEAQEAALAIGKLLRRTGLVSRGIGTIRQDLNVSIPGGARVEIKGVQELTAIAATVELEVQRQQQLLAISAEAQKRLAGAPIEAKFVDLTEIFEGTQSQLVGKILRAGGRLLGMRLPGHDGLLGREVSPGRRYGSELADYARSAGLRGLMHSDEDFAAYGFSEDEISETKVALSVLPGDAFVLCAGEQKKAQQALSEVCCRASFPGVPEETRKANPDGTSSYMRPLPGKARMYPETDIPPIRVTGEMLAEAGQAMLSMEKAEEQKTEALSTVNSELSSQLAQAKGLLSHSALFKSQMQTPELAAFAAAQENGVDSRFAASIITNTLQSLKREGCDTKALDEPRLLSFLLASKSGVFAKSASIEVLREMCREKGATPQGAVAKLGLQKITGKALSKLIQDGKLDFKALMAKYRLRVEAVEAQGIFKKSG
jgi:glutamyl-tRNA(Gln) amidotransferase subunit E